MAATNTRAIPKAMPFRQACRESGFSPSTLRDAHHRGELAIIKVGASARHQAWFVTVDEMRRFMEAHTERVA